MARRQISRALTMGPSSLVELRLLLLLMESFLAKGVRVVLQHEIARRVGIFHTNTSSPSHIPICHINGEIPEGPQIRVFGCLSAFSSLCAISRAPFGTGRNYPSWKNSPRARSRWFSYGLGGLENGNNAHPSIHPRVGVNQKTKRGEENYERRRRRRLLSITPAKTGEREAIPVSSLLLLSLFGTIHK